MKWCKCCDTYKNLSEFYKRKNSNDGHMNECKECVKASRKRHYIDNKDAVKSRVKKYRNDNPEKVKKAQREYRNNNRDKLSESYSIYYNENKSKILERCKNYAFEHKEDIRVYKKNYRIYNKDKIKKYKEQNKEHIKNVRSAYKKNNKCKIYANNAKRRAMRINQLHPDHSVKLEESMRKKAQIMEKLFDEKFVIDHILPLSRGGLHHHKNLQIMPANLNLEKSDSLEWRHEDYKHWSELPDFLKEMRPTR